MHSSTRSVRRREWESDEPGQAAAASYTQAASAVRPGLAPAACWPLPTAPEVSVGFLSKSRGSISV